MIDSVPFHVHSSFLNILSFRYDSFDRFSCFKYLFSSFSLVISDSRKCRFYLNMIYFHLLFVCVLGDRLDRLIFSASCIFHGGLWVQACRCPCVWLYDQIWWDLWVLEFRISSCYVLGLGFLFHIYTWHMFVFLILQKTFLSFLT